MSVRHYLQHHGEDTAAATLIRETYAHVLCIPAFAEDRHFLRGLQALPKAAPVLVMIMVNAPDSAVDTRQLQSTRELLLHFREQLPLCRQSGNASLLQLDQAAGHDLLLIDRCSEGLRLPARQGVGLARKALCDIACRLIDEGRISSPWIHSSDADVSFPGDYFNAASGLPACSAALYPFRHQPHRDPPIRQSQELYDLSLHYYVAGLKWAGSPYAFHTIGSTLLLHHRRYALVRGFPKRNAAEDFYLLNKLAKVAPVINLSAPVLQIESRLSRRVPFGTGPAVGDIAALADPRRDYRYYNPDAFLCLRTLLEELPALWEDRYRLSKAPPHTLSTFLSQYAPAQYRSAWSRVLERLHIEKGLIHALEQSGNETSFIRHFHQWFDAFRTLKFIHLLREECCPSVNLDTLGRNTLYRQNILPLIPEDVAIEG